MAIDETHLIANSEYFEVSLSNSDDDNENSIHFIDSNHEFECIEEEEEAISQPHTEQQHGADNDGDDDDDDDDENAENYYTIEIEDDFDTDFEKDSLIA